MDYQVWTKDEYGDLWRKEVAGDLEAAKRIVLEASKEGKEIMLTVEVPFELQLKVGEPGSEVKKPGKRSAQAQKEIDEEETKIETDPHKTE